MKLFRFIATIIAISLAALGAASVSNPTPALATNLVVEGASPEVAAELQQIVNESQEPTPNLTITVHIGSCPTESSEDNGSCILYPNKENQWPLPQIWMDPKEHSFVILHELGHASSWELDPEFRSNGTMSPLAEEFEQIVGKPGWKWAIFAGEPGINEAPIEEWADTMLSCSWMGRVATGPTAITPGYGFVLTATQYNEVCAFFARTLVGPQFTQPTVAPLPPIPYNYMGSALCGARPELVEFCGHAPEPQGFGKPESFVTRKINAKTRPVHHTKHPKEFEQKGQLAEPTVAPVGVTRIEMARPREQAEFQSIVDRSQEPTPNLTVKVHRKSCPYLETAAKSCVAYPSHENGWTVPQIWISPKSRPFTILGELGYLSWWELDPSTEAASTAARELSESFQRIVDPYRDADLAWRTTGVEDSNGESPTHLWADTFLSCSWMGRVAHHEEGIQTVGYEFQVPSAEYNATCAFFLKTLVGPRFSLPSTPPLPIIPDNYSGSPECGARPELVRFCGTQKGWNEGAYNVVLENKIVTEPVHKHHHAHKSKKKRK
jgi:hypothetical protein